MAELESWQPENVLPERAVNFVRYSRGFLRLKPEKWLAGLAGHWSPLFHNLGLKVEQVQIAMGFDFPADLARISSIELDGELAVIGTDRSTVAALSAPLVTTGDTLRQQVLMEYLERRFTATLSLAAPQQLRVPCYYIAAESSRAVEVGGVIEIQFLVNHQNARVYLGIGPRFLDRIDDAWRQTIAASVSDGDMPSADDLVSVDVELVELSVSPATLIDYVRSGKVIPLDVEAAGDVYLRRNGERWAAGKLCRSAGRFAVEITSLSPKLATSSPGMTRLVVRVAQVELDRLTLNEHAQVGAVLLTGTMVSSRAVLSISGEEVGSGELSVVDGKYRVTVLAK